MGNQDVPSDTESQDVRIKELTEENELLFEQLHVVQEELEKYYHKLKECEQRKGATVASPSLSLASHAPQLSEALADNQKLRALVTQQKFALHVEAKNSLSARLGDMLIEGVGSTRGIFALPGRLRKMWKALERTTPPSALGGKSFQAVIDVYTAGGADALEKLLNSVFIAPSMRANAYTALARHLMIIDVQKAAEFAHRAYEIDPRPYRLKWLAFRMHDADDAITAEAMLDMLPADIPMSESEQRQVARIRYESAQMRKKNAETDKSVQEEKKAEDQKVVQLTNKVEEYRREVEHLLQHQKEVQRIADTRQEDLQAVQARLAEQVTLAERHVAELEALKSMRDDLQTMSDSYRSEAETLHARLAQQQAAQEKQVEEWQKEYHSIITAQEESQARANSYKNEVDALQTRLAEQEALANARKVEMDTLSLRLDEMNKVYLEQVRILTDQQKYIVSAIASQSSAIGSGFEKQGMDLERVRKSVQQSCKYEIDNALQQATAYSGLSTYFEFGKLPEVTPWKRGWPASPDFVLWLVELIDQNDYDLILEFGSGTTTLYIAKTLAARKKKNGTAKIARTLAFEHLEQFFLQTKSILSQAGFNERINVIHAPLQEYTAPCGTAYQYYSCQETLNDLSLHYKSANSNVLVIVDGPPGVTCKNARYPAFPLVMKYFASAHIDFLLDDYIRGDEKEIATMWQNACATAGIEHAIVEKQLEKEALLLRIAPLHAEMK